MNNKVFPPTPSQEKNIRSLGSYFFRNSTSRKPNSEVDLHFFFFSFFLHFPQAIGVWEDCVSSKVCALDRRIRRRSCGWKRLWLLKLACAELGVFGVTGTILLVWWHRFSAAEKVGYPWQLCTIWQSFLMPCHSRITIFVMISQLQLHKQDLAIMQCTCKYFLPYIIMPRAVHVQVLAHP